MPGGLIKFTKSVLTILKKFKTANAICRYQRKTLIMTLFPCPYLASNVELTDERELHIANHHPDLLPAYRQYIADTLADPDQVRRSVRFGNARLFTRWFESLRRGKYVVVVVVSDSAYSTKQQRHWIITSYIARKLAKGENIEWERI